MSAIHMFFPITSSGDLDDGDPIPASTDFGRVVNHKPRPFTLGCISSALLDLLPCACVSAPHTDTQYGLGDGSPIIHDPTSILPLPPRRSTPPSYMSQAMPIPTAIDYQHLPVTACCVLEPSGLSSTPISSCSTTYPGRPPVDSAADIDIGPSHTTASFASSDAPARHRGRLIFAEQLLSFTSTTSSLLRSMACLRPGCE